MNVSLSFPSTTAIPLWKCTNRCAAAVPERAQRATVAGKLGPFHPLIRERWDAGERDVKQLLEELKQAGYTGSLSRVYDYVQILRQQSKPSRVLKADAGKFSTREVVSMILTPLAPQSR